MGCGPKEAREQWMQGVGVKEGEATGLCPRGIAVDPKETGENWMQGVGWKEEVSDQKAREERKQGVGVEGLKKDGGRGDGFLPPREACRPGHDRREKGRKGRGK